MGSTEATGSENFQRSEEYRVGSRGAGLKQALKDIFFGAFVFALYQQVLRMKAKYADIFRALILGEFLGIPLLSNYFTLKLFPYVYGDLASVRERLLRDIDVLELLHEGPAVH